MASRVTSTRFVGRAAELDELRGALAEAAGGRPSLAFVAGESGVGKTRLLAEVERAARADGHARDRRRLRRAGGGRAALRADRRRAAPAGPRRRPRLRRSSPTPPAARSRRSSPASARAGPTTRRPRRRACSTRLLELLELLAGEDGLMVTIEDLHWADRSTRAFLVYLASSLCRERVLVVTTYRPDELHRRHPLRPLLAELERDARHRRVELRPLTRAELGEQLTDILGNAPAEDLLTRLFARSEGNPLFAEELLAAGTDGRGSLPPTLRDALMLRIERLSGEAQETLRLLAAARRLDHETLAEASGVDPRALREALREAVAAQLVVADEEGRYAFRHALLREVVADDLLPGERAELHLALARALERRAEGLPGHGGAHLAAGHRASLPRLGRPAARAGRQRPRRRGRRGASTPTARPRRSTRARCSSGTASPDAEELAGRDHVDLLRAAAWTTGREHEPGPRRDATCAPRWHELGDSDPQRSAGAARGASRASSSTSAAPPTPPRRAGDALDAAARRPERGARDAARRAWSKELMLESRYAGGRRGRRGGARASPAPRATRSPSCARWTAWASRCSASPATRRARRRCARRCARSREAGLVHTALRTARQPRRRAGRLRAAGRGARARRRGRRAGAPTRARRGAG